MTEFEFTPSGAVFANRSALSEEYVPDTLVGRDEELTEYFNALQPVIENENPSNLLLYGKSGVGKTASTRYLLQQLKEDSKKIDALTLHTLTVNCENHNTSYQAVVSLVNALRDDEDAIPSTGYPQSKVIEFLIDEINALNGTLLIVLDEVDALNDDTLLYRLTRAREDGYVTGTYLGVIGISNDLKYRDRLRPKVRSSLCEKTVLFAPYNASELQKVIEQRIDTAFQDGVVDQSAVTACAAYGSRNSGDARLALDLLQQAGDLARTANDEVVTDEHVIEARKQIERDRVIDTVQNYSQHGKYTLLSLLQLDADGETPCRSRVVQRRYRRLCEEEGLEPVSERAIRDYLAELDSLGIISSEMKSESDSGGQFKTHSVVGDVAEMKNALLDSIE